MMERAEILTAMGELKLHGMKDAYDEIIATAVKRQHEPQRVVGDLLTAEMVGAEAATIGRLRARLWDEIGSFLTRRIDVALSAEERSRLAQYRAAPPESLSGRRVASVNLLDGIKLIFEDGSWILVRESGTEPIARVYVEAKSAGDVSALAAAAQGLLKE